MSAIRKLLTAFVAPFQTLEDTIRTAILMRDVRTATGVWLTKLGNFVGQPRQGVADDELYRRYVFARILTNKSDGQPETMYRIARKILGATGHTLKIDNLGIDAFVMKVGALPLDYPTAKIVISFLRQAASSGYRVVLEFLVLAPSATFCFATGPGLGFRSFDGTTGGGFAAAIE